MQQASQDGNNGNCGNHTLGRKIAKQLREFDSLGVDNGFCEDDDGMIMNEDYLNCSPGTGCNSSDNLSNRDSSSSTTNSNTNVATNKNKNKTNNNSYPSTALNTLNLNSLTTAAASQIANLAARRVGIPQQSQRQGQGINTYRHASIHPKSGNTGKATIGSIGTIGTTATVTTAMGRGTSVMQQQRQQQQSHSHRSLSHSHSQHSQQSQQSQHSQHSQLQQQQIMRKLMGFGSVSGSGSGGSVGSAGSVGSNNGATGVHRARITSFDSQNSNHNGNHNTIVASGHNTASVATTSIPNQVIQILCQNGHTALPNALKQVQQQQQQQQQMSHLNVSNVLMEEMNSSEETAGNTEPTVPSQNMGPVDASLNNLAQLLAQRQLQAQAQVQGQIESHGDKQLHRLKPMECKNTNHKRGDNENGDLLIHSNDGFDKDQRYIALEMLGKGTFGQVVKCFDRLENECIALKVIRNKPAYHNQAKVEIKILKLLEEQCIKSKHKGIINLQSYFEHENHLCLVFPLMHINLFQLMKNNNYAGFTVTAIRVFVMYVYACTFCLFFFLSFFSFFYFCKFNLLHCFRVFSCFLFLFSFVLCFLFLLIIFCEWVVVVYAVVRL